MSGTLRPQASILRCPLPRCDDQRLKQSHSSLLTIPNQLGPEYNLHVMQAFAEHVAPALGWKPNTEGPVVGDAI